MRNLVTFTRALESVKIGTLTGSFCTKEKRYVAFILIEELFVMTIRNNTKFKEELTCNFKTNMRNLANSISSTRKSKKMAL